MISFVLTILKSRLRLFAKTIILFVLALFGIKKWRQFFDTLDEKAEASTPSIIKTLYFNLRLLPRHQARVLPIYVYKGIRFQKLSGEISLGEKIYPGMVLLGYDWGFRCKGETRIRIEGKVAFQGKCWILRGADVCVFSGGVLTIGDDVYFCENTLVYCLDRITFGNKVRMAYESQVLDTDFHYTVNLDTREIHRRSAPVVIGSHVWIGNRTTIKKGVRIPDYTIVAASGSLLTKDYTGIVDRFGCLGGCPAKPLPIRICRTWKNEMERIGQLDQWFADHPESKVFIIPDSERIEDYTDVNTEEDDSEQ